MSPGVRLGACAALALASVVACAHGDARFPSRPSGCDVKVFHMSPEVPTENIGPVQARCAEDIPEADCLRSLMDAVCDLGGDVVWGVDAPEHVNGKNRYSGRAAHTKAPKARAP